MTEFRRSKAGQARELDRARQAALAALGRIVGAKRRLLVTDIPGQDLVYAAKEREAREYLAARDRNPADFPLITAEVGITAPNAVAVAGAFLARAKANNRALASLEARRRRLVIELEAAASTAEIAEIQRRGEIDLQDWKPE